MALLLLMGLLLVATFGVLLSALYFVVESPASKRRMRTRLATMQQLYAQPSGGGEAQFLQEEVVGPLPSLSHFLARLPFLSNLQTFLYQAAVEMTVDTVLVLCFGLSVLAGIAGSLANFALPLLTTLAVAAIAGMTPWLVIALKRQRRFSRFEEIFPDAIDLLARAVRAGHAFTTGFELIAREMPEPVASEFQITFEQQNLGMPLGEALDKLTERVPLPDVRFFVSALQIQRESGGNLAEILTKLSYVIRERFKLVRQVQVHTAEGRLSLYILTAIPPLTSLLLYLVNRDYIMTLFRDPLGQRLVAVAIVFQLVGYVVTRKITQPRV